MFYPVTSRHGKPRAFTVLDQTCVTAPPLLLVLSKHHYNGIKTRKNGRIQMLLMKKHDQLK